MKGKGSPKVNQLKWKAKCNNKYEGKSLKFNLKAETQNYVYILHQTTFSHNCYCAQIL